MQSWPLATPSRTGIHDVAPAPDGGVWFTAQRSGHLGWFDPQSARVELIALGRGSSPHGVIQGPDRAAWITDSGQNAIVRVGWPDRAVRVFPLPEGSSYANLNTAAFDGDGDLWFTGQSGIVGKLAVKSGAGQRQGRAEGPRAVRHLRHAGRRRVVVFARRLVHRPHRPQDGRLGRRRAADQGTRARAASGATAAAASGSASGTRASSRCTTRPPRRAAQAWRAWKLPGDRPSCYAVYVDERDIVWASDFGGNAVWRFDPSNEKFERFGFAREATNIRQILGRPGEVWLPESGTEHLSVIRTAA